MNFPGFFYTFLSKDEKSCSKEINLFISKNQIKFFANPIIIYKYFLW